MVRAGRERESMTETGLIQDGRAPRRVTLITGASGGIGADLARVFARHGAGGVECGGDLGSRASFDQIEHQQQRPWPSGP